MKDKWWNWVVIAPHLDLGQKQKIISSNFGRTHEGVESDPQHQIPNQISKVFSRLEILWSLKFKQFCVIFHGSSPTVKLFPAMNQEHKQSLSLRQTAGGLPKLARKLSNCQESVVKKSSSSNPL